MSDPIRSRVEVRAGALASVEERFAGRDGVFLVTDENVAPLLPLGLRDLTGRVIPPGEGSKSWTALGALLGDMDAAALDRDGHVLAVGGGVVTDLAGLAASLHRRGVDWTAVPTSLVGQVDANDNFEELEAYQVYAQVKGPLGRINLRAGRYILPFGLLANLDTERQLIQSLEPLSLGIKLDTGVQVFGFTGPFDYAVSISQGTGELDDPDSNKLLVARLGRQGEDGRWGLSYLDGRVVVDAEDFLQQGRFDRQRLAVDAEFDFVPWLLRGELIAGKDDGRSVYGGILLADYDFNARLSLNTKLAWWNSTDDAREVALGVSYRLPKNFILRAADTYQRLNGAGEHSLALQLYWEFSHAL